MDAREYADRRKNTPNSGPRINVRMSEDLVREIDMLWRDKYEDIFGNLGHDNRSQVIRTAVKKYLDEHGTRELLETEKRVQAKVETDGGRR